MTTDPVCGMKVDAEQRSCTIGTGWKEVQFLLQQCKDKFDRSPEQFVENAASEKIPTL